MLNKATIIGNVGNDPEIRSMQNGEKVANLSIATTERWKDKDTGEQKEATEWHKVVVFGASVEKFIEPYVKKGSKLYIEGKLQTRSWEQDGQKKYSTEIVCQGFGSKVISVSGKSSEANEPQEPSQASGGFGD